MVGLVFPMETHGGQKTREKGEISKIKLLQSKNKLRAFVEEEENMEWLLFFLSFTFRF